MKNNKYWINRLLAGILISFATIIINAQDLEAIAIEKIDSLQSLMTKAKEQGIDVQKEDMTIITARIFLKYSNVDENNMASVKSHWNAHPYYSDEQKTEYAEDQPDFQRRGVIDILDNQISEIKQVLAGTITRYPTTVIDWKAIDNHGNKLTQNGKPVFLADYVWKPSDDTLNKYFGAFDSEGHRVSYIQDEDGNHESWTYNDFSNKQNEGIGQIWTDQNGVPDWAKTKWPDITVGHRHYGGFDVDHAGSKKMYSLMYEKYAPLLKDAKVVEMGYQLWNEPSFFTKADSWNNTDENGVCVSDSTIKHFKIWLEEKHGSIENLNSIWGKSYSNFDDVSVTLPMQGSLQGGPIWFDWMSFHNFRITRWFQFMKDEIIKYDTDARVHIKLMPWTWSENAVDHGLDFEALTELSGLSGCDAGMQYEHGWKTDLAWKNKYALNWRHALMTFDFFRSVKPNQFIIDTENHFLMNTGFNPRDLNQNYVRMSYWLGTMFGMSAKNTWVWIRDADGRVTKPVQASSSTDISHQPKTLHTITSTYMDINSNAEDMLKFQELNKPVRVFFSITSAINDNVYMDKLFSTYESMFFEGIPVGFATENIIKKGDELDVILVRENTWVTDAEFNALQSYLDNGGTIIIDGLSLAKNEYGEDRDETLDAGNGKILPLSSLSDMRTKALQEVESSRGKREVVVDETNKNMNIPGCIWRYIKLDNGGYLLTIANLGKSEANISVSIPEAKIGTKAINKFTGNEIATNLTLKPYDFYYLMLTDEKGAILTSDEINSLKPKSGDFAELYPNPSNGQFLILFDKVYDTTIGIYNMQGKLLQSSSHLNEQQVNMNLSEYDKGVYFVMISNKENKQVIKYIKE